MINLIWIYLIKNKIIKYLIIFIILIYLIIYYLKIRTINRKIKDLEKQNNKVKYLTVGTLAEKIGEVLSNYGFFVKSFDNNKDVACYILENLDKSNTIFLKASRSMKFEQILEEIKKRDI